MPELPEVETVRRGLNQFIVHKTIQHVHHDAAKSFPNAPKDVEQFLIGAHITAVRRRAKVLIVDLSTNYSLLIHLKMTGQLVYIDNADRFGAGHPNDSLVHTLPDRSTRVTIDFEQGVRLFFNDQRKFGWVKLMPTTLIAEVSFMQKVGPEPLEDDFTEDVLIKRMRRRKNSPIKAVLLDQSVLAGVGNIYADESLWAAKIHPSVRVREVTDQQLKVLHRELRAILQLAIEKGGSTNKNYVNAEGKKGSYMDFAKVFRREGQPCPRCGMIIIKTRVAGRGTHICLHCQAEPQHD